MQGFVSNLCQQQAAEAKNAKRTYGTSPLGEPRLVRKLSSSNPETSRSPTHETGNTRIGAQLRSEWPRNRHAYKDYPETASSVRSALSKLSDAKCRQIANRTNKWFITDLGITRIEEHIARESGK
jgi:hypothetical protein